MTKCNWDIIDLERMDNIVIEYKDNVIIKEDDKDCKIELTFEQLERIYMIQKMNRKNKMV